jgi:HTH-type transcriptional regulator, competence development regulator
MPQLSVSTGLLHDMMEIEIVLEKEWKPMKQELHTQLRNAREEMNLSFDELALRTRIGESRLAAFESGEELPSVQHIFLLSNALDVPASNLLEALEAKK